MYFQLKKKKNNTRTLSTLLLIRTVFRENLFQWQKPRQYNYFNFISNNFVNGYIGSMPIPFEHVNRPVRIIISSLFFFLSC